MVAQALPHARREERSEVAVHRGPGRECRRGRQVPPLAARAHDIEQSVEQAAHVGCSWPPSRLSGRDERLQQPVLVVAQRLAGAKIPNQNTICRRPHHGLPEESPRNGITTAAHISSSRPIQPFKTGYEYIDVPAAQGCIEDEYVEP